MDVCLCHQVFPIYEVKHSKYNLSISFFHTFNVQNYLLWNHLHLRMIVHGLPIPKSLKSLMQLKDCEFGGVVKHPSSLVFLKSLGMGKIPAPWVLKTFCKRVSPQCTRIELCIAGKQMYGILMIDMVEIIVKVPSIGRLQKETIVVIIQNRFQPTLSINIII